MGEGGGMVSSSQRDARSSSLQRMVRPRSWNEGHKLTSAEPILRYLAVLESEVHEEIVDSERG